MSIENSLERIATALETIVAKGTTSGAATEEARPRVVRKSKVADPVPNPVVAAEPVVEEASPTTTQEPEEVEKDLFAEDPVAEKEAEKPKLTDKDVRAKLVLVQTTLKGKEHAIKLLGKHTVPKGECVLSKLPESAYAALIAEADKALAAGKVA